MRLVFLLSTVFESQNLFNLWAGAGAGEGGWGVVTGKGLGWAVQNNQSWAYPQINLA